MPDEIDIRFWALDIEGHVPQRQRVADASGTAADAILRLATFKARLLRRHSRHIERVARRAHRDVIRNLDMTADQVQCIPRRDFRTALHLDAFGRVCACEREIASMQEALQRLIRCIQRREDERARVELRGGTDYDAIGVDEPEVARPRAVERAEELRQVRARDMVDERAGARERVVQCLAGPDAERVPIDETGACDIDCAAARNRSVRDACDIALDDLAACRHGKDALRERQADGRRQEGLSCFMMESPFHDVHFPLRTASSG